MVSEGTGGGLKLNTIPTSGYELPDRYEKDLLQLLTRDSQSLYVYWEVGNRKRWLCSQHFECDWGELPKVLRIYDVSAIYFNGSNANRHFDLELTPEASSWYIHGVQAGTTYMADLGVYTMERQFVPLLRSNAVMTPRDHPVSWGAPLVPVIPEVSVPGPVTASLRPRDFENFNAYSNCMK